MGPWITVNCLNHSQGLFQLFLGLCEREGLGFSSCEHAKVSPVVHCSLALVEPVTLWQQVRLTIVVEE